MSASYRPVRLAIVVSHPIQHFVPFYRRIAQERGIALRVFFMSDFSVRGYFDPLMKTQIVWKMDMLSGYDHEFLPEASTINRSSPRTLNNPSVGSRLQAFAPDIVLNYGYNQLTSLRVRAWCYKMRVPVIMTSDSELLHERTPWRKTIKGVVVPRVLSGYAAFLSTGDNNEDYFRHYGVTEQKLFRTPFTIDEEVYLQARCNRQALRSELRASIGLAETDFLAIVVGKLSPGKRPQDVIASARLIKKRMPKNCRIQFAMAGDGQMRAEMEATIQSEALPVKMLGFINVDKLPAIYCAADALLHLSEVDAHPLALSEAACIGLPLIVSDRVGAVGPTDIAREGENTIVVPCGDANVIADAVARLAGDEALCRSMSEASLRIYGELDMRRSVTGLISALDYVLKRPQAHDLSA